MGRENSVPVHGWAAVAVCVFGGISAFAWSGTVVVYAPPEASIATLAFMGLLGEFAIWCVVDTALDLVCEATGVPMGCWYAQLPQRVIAAAAVPPTVAIIAQSGAGARGIWPMYFDLAAVTTVFTAWYAQRRALKTTFHTAARAPHHDTDVEGHHETSTWGGCWLPTVLFFIAAVAMVGNNLLVTLSYAPKDVAIALLRVAACPLSGFALQRALFVARTSPDIVPADTPLALYRSHQPGSTHGGQSPIPRFDSVASLFSPGLHPPAGAASFSTSATEQPHRSWLRQLVVELKLPVSLLRQRAAWSMIVAAAAVAVEVGTMQTPAASASENGPVLGGPRGPSIGVAWGYGYHNVGLLLIASFAGALASLAFLRLIEGNIVPGAVCASGGTSAVMFVLYALLRTSPSPVYVVTAVTAATAGCLYAVQGKPALALHVTRWGRHARPAPARLVRSRSRHFMFDEEQASPPGDASDGDIDGNGLAR